MTPSRGASSRGSATTDGSGYIGLAVSTSGMEVIRSTDRLRWSDTVPRLTFSRWLSVVYCVGIGPQCEGQALPVRLHPVHLEAVGVRNFAEEPKRRPVVEVAGLPIQVLGKKRAAQRAHDAGVPDRGVHLGMTGERIGVQIAGGDRGPHRAGND